MDHNAEQFNLPSPWAHNFIIVLTLILSGSGLDSVQGSLVHQTVTHAFLDLALSTGAQSFCKRKGPATNCSHKVESTDLKHSTFLSLELRDQSQLLKSNPTL